MIAATMLAVLTLFGAPAQGKMPSPVSYGKPFAVVRPVPLPELPKLAKELMGKKIQLAGPVHKVCTKKGCWMSLADGESSVRIGFKDYSFFMPTSLPAGTIVVVKGVLGHRELSDAQVEHMKKEGADMNSNRELRIVAEGVWVMPKPE